ncbi:acyl-CoA carboxylase subunit epsilon [Microbispora sp. NBC_01189]|uniref:acyl-CoA carboxylase subunit epsilon n=1 Tax=Microbispora sp. NBC_01189 TaxID=2903583 RepID=UPI002E13AA26|nr:acyl-CoA carboxylase subunit epsilon [Microbispora sp. NBC_01189]
MGGAELRVVAGNPTEEEICALVCALYAVAADRADNGELAPVAGPKRPRPRLRLPDYGSPRSWVACHRTDALTGVR